MSIKETFSKELNFLYDKSLEYKDEDMFKQVIIGFINKQNTKKIKQGYKDFPKIFRNEQFIEQINRLSVKYDNLEMVNFFLENNIQVDSYPLTSHVIFYKESCPNIFNDMIKKKLI